MNDNELAKLVTIIVIFVALLTATVLATTTATTASESISFLELTDTPSSFTGEAGKTLSVNEAEGALEFQDPFTETLDPVDSTTFRYTLPGWSVVGMSSATTSSGVLYHIPFFVSNSGRTFPEAVINVTTADAGSIGRACLYEWSEGSPGSLISDYGTVDVGTTGEKVFTTSETLARGYYFLSFVTDGTPSLTRVSTVGLLPVSGYASAVASSERIIPATSGTVAGDPCADPAASPTSLTFFSAAWMRWRLN